MWIHILSWVIVIGLLGGIYWLVSNSGLLSGGNNSAVKHPITEVRKSRMRNTKSMKQAQAQRHLPKKYSTELVKQSEQRAKKELQSQIRKFQEMSQKMRLRRDALLDKVEKRRLPAGAPYNANDTREAKAIPRVQQPNLSNMSVEDIYNLLRDYEDEIQKNHIAVSAAKQALTKGQSFPEVYRALKTGTTRMPSYENLLARTGGYGEGGMSISSTADLNEYRDILSEANRQAGLASSRLSNLFGAGRSVRFSYDPNGFGKAGAGSNKGGSGKNGNGGNVYCYGNGGNGYGNGEGGGEGEAGDNDGVAKTPFLVYSGRKIDVDLAKARALPGRRFTHDAKRSGWLYVNTWYMIGPWESFGRNDFAIVHPPEISVDFDAVYTDGQRGKGIEEVDAHPTRIVGREVYLDGTLRWKFMQSESLHNVVPVTTGHSTYYAYTELFFDEATTMLVAIGTDDSGRVWINDEDVWQDTGTSWYNIDEHITYFKFRQGWNKVLIRLENGGGGPCGFSFLIIPT